MECLSYFNESRRSSWSPEASKELFNMKGRKYILQANMKFKFVIQFDLFINMTVTDLNISLLHLFFALNIIFPFSKTEQFWFFSCLGWSTNLWVHSQEYYSIKNNIPSNWCSDCIFSVYNRDHFLHSVKPVNLFRVTENCLIYQNKLIHLFKSLRNNYLILGFIFSIFIE